MQEVVILKYLCYICVKLINNPSLERNQNAF